MNPDGIQPPEWLRARVEAAVGRASVTWAKPDCGLSAAHRFRVQLQDGSGVFVKAATDDETERWLRTEHLALSRLTAAFMPRVLAWLDEPGARPILLSEDLSDAYWPASHAGVVWRDGDLDRVFAGIQAMAAVAPPDELPALTNPASPRWSAIARNPTPFLALGVCSRGWLDRCAVALAEAEAGVDLAGDRLVHGDIRSDNVCLAGRGAVFVDWSHASRGNAAHNLASVLPSLHLEGGPPPFDVMPDGGNWAALAAGSLVVRTVNDPAAPAWLRHVLVRLIAISLAWATRALGLPEPGGAEVRGH